MLKSTSIGWMAGREAGRKADGQAEYRQMLKNMSIGRQEDRQIDR
jgi:hypothetical protein